MKKNPSACCGSRPGRLALPCWAAPVVLVLAALSMLAGCGEADDPTYPTPPAPQVRNWLFDVLGTSATDIWACGNKGAMFHYDGTAWNPVSMNTADPIVGMVQAPDGTMYAFGHKGRIWRRNGDSWSAMETGTTANFYGCGSYLGSMYAVGEDGLMRRLGGSTWSDPGLNDMILRDENGAPQDTLYVNQDVEVLVTVNYFALGGAYREPSYVGDDLGMLGTRGMILAADNDENFDWRLRPLGGDRLIDEEWILCSRSDPAVIRNNYLGTSEGWLFRLNDDGSWVLQAPKITLDPGGGVRDIWLDSANNLYIATDEGQIVYQSADYDFEAIPPAGERVTLADFTDDFSAIWGTSPQNLYVVGFVEEKILHVSHDQGTGEFTVLEEISVPFPDKAAAAPAADQFGRPRP